VVELSSVAMSEAAIEQDHAKTEKWSVLNGCLTTKAGICLAYFFQILLESSGKGALAGFSDEAT
jgi:hypothetical protein